MDSVLAYGLFIFLGVLAGTLSGLLGVGGGVIVVPGFIYLFQYEGFPNNIIMHMAAGSSLAAMIVTAFFSLYAHYKRGAVFGAILYYMIPGLIVGTSVGTILAHFTHSEILKILFGLLMIGIALKDYVGQPKGKQKESQQQRGKILIIIGSTVIGILSGLLGVGGGTLIIPFLQYCGIGIRQAVSISVACGLVVAITGTAGFILTGLNLTNLPHDSLGYIYVPAWIGVSIGSPIFAFLGAMLHQRLKVSVLKRIFNVFLFIVGIRLLT